MAEPTHELLLRSAMARARSSELIAAARLAVTTANVTVMRAARSTVEAATAVESCRAARLSGRARRGASG